MTVPFTGSYSADDVEFLLTPIEMEDTPVLVKEALIQSGRRHYSEMLTRESLPSDVYVQLFHDALALNGRRMAGHLLALAERIVRLRKTQIALVSLARAGTPVGVLLKHVLQRHFGRKAAHYSLSILRDKGIDRNALRHILQRHSPDSLVFVDGWTGKGVIASELATSLDDFAASDGIRIPADLFVLADLSGSAAVAASNEDYLIPSCVLNSTVSGLISRSVWRQGRVDPAAFHGCLYYKEFEPYDLSRFFVDAMLDYAEEVYRQFGVPVPEAQYDSKRLKGVSLDFLKAVAQQYRISHYNYIKPGIGEATRVLLRREAGRLLLRNPDSEATRHLLWLAESKSIPIEVRRNMPYRAAALIKEVK
ncbi:cysteine protease StiP family protein [Candidatus Methylomicrobium oryzae]|uniref:cysteine protease StiP family protein n=1 Tax=Candidatus Methylomicrobium oryzae TaxID=2802053 RepID=UPI0019214FC0|nr:cysteine protease StiP family protein [Methylomicrobium sp. RS1]MBL1265470.1 cysteine protease StiP family protein [Methylomicrobium sp. RS1]